MQEIEQIMDDRISVEWLILADAAEVVGAKLYMLGGGWDRLTVNSQPARQNIAVALAFWIPWFETNKQHSFQLEIADEDGKNLVTMEGGFEVGRPPGLPHGQPQLIQLAMNSNVSFDRLGAYVITARASGGDARSTQFNVVPGPGLAMKSPPT